MMVTDCYTCVYGRTYDFPLELTGRALDIYNNSDFTITYDGNSGTFDIYGGHNLTPSNHIGNFQNDSEVIEYLESLAEDC